MPPRSARSTTSARWLAGVIVAVLAVATIVLVVLALQSVRPSAVQASPLPEPTFGRSTPDASASPGSSDGSPAPSPSGSASGGDAGASSYPREVERFLSLGSDGWWRATAGSCGGPAPLLERSVDGGQTWDDVTPNYRDIAQIVSLDSFAGSEAEVVAGMGGACETQALRTFTQGEFWQPYGDVLEASRYLDVSDAAAVVLPDGVIAAPCADARSFRAAGDVVALVCDGVPSVLGDDGRWSALPVSGAVAVAVDGDAVLTATSASDCEGAVVTRWSGAGFASGAPLGCAVGADPSEPLAIAAVDEEAVVWSGAALIPVG